MRFNMLTLDVDGQKISLPWSRDEPPSKDEEDAIKERVRASLTTTYPIAPKCGAPVPDYFTYSISGSPDALDAARYRWLRADNAYAPEEDMVRGGEDLDKLCDEGIVGKR